MSKIVLLFVCMAVFQLANALQCYHCDREACDKDMKDWQKSKCGEPSDTKSVSACLKQVYKDKTSQKDTVSRKCVIVEKSQKYKCSTAAGGEEIFCETCDKDFCNSASRINFSAVAATGVFLALVIPKIFA